MYFLWTAIGNRVLNLQSHQHYWASKGIWNCTFCLCHLQTRTQTLIFMCERGKRERLNLHQIPKSCHWLQTLWILHSRVLLPGDRAVCLYFSIGSFWYGLCSPDLALYKVSERDKLRIPNNCPFFLLIHSWSLCCGYMNAVLCGQHVKNSLRCEDIYYWMLNIQRAGRQTELDVHYISMYRMIIYQFKQRINFHEACVIYEWCGIAVSISVRVTCVGW